MLIMPGFEMVTIRDFKQRTLKGDPVCEISDAQPVLCEVDRAPDLKATDFPAEERVLRFKISTEAKGRDGDIIRLSGWDLKRYKKNPVVLWAHDSYAFPIARSLKTW